MEREWACRAGQNMKLLVKEVPAKVTQHRRVSVLF